VKPFDLGKGIKTDNNVIDLINKIKENGWVVPISITSDGFIVDGEHRYKALMELGVDKIPAYVGKQLGSSGRLEQTYQGLPIDIKNLHKTEK
jgi:ParB-like chromosome segregation protein Spo0J